MADKDKATREAEAAAQHLEAKMKEAQVLRDVSGAVAETIGFTVSCKRLGKHMHVFTLLP